MYLADRLLPEALEGGVYDCMDAVAVACFYTCSRTCRTATQDYLRRAARIHIPDPTLHPCMLAQPIHAVEPDVDQSPTAWTNVNVKNDLYPVWVSRLAHYLPLRYARNARFLRVNWAITNKAVFPSSRASDSHDELALLQGRSRVATWLCQNSGTLTQIEGSGVVWSTIVLHALSTVHYLVHSEDAYATSGRRVPVSRV
jgi:hypothetical protein